MQRDSRNALVALGAVILLLGFAVNHHYGWIGGHRACPAGMVERQIDVGSGQTTEGCYQL